MSWPGSERVTLGSITDRLVDGRRGRRPSNDKTISNRKTNNRRLGRVDTETLVMIREWHEQVKRSYSSSLGRPRGELATPALVLDLDLARRNLQFMAAKLKSLQVGL